jgi:hypothetical protein
MEDAQVEKPQTQNKWYNNIYIVTLCCFIFLPLGIYGFLRKYNYKWYEQDSIVLTLCFFFFPLGIYGLWKGNMTKQAKVTLTIIIVLVMLKYYSTLNY